MALSLPSSFASQELYSTYYLAQPDDYDPVKSGMTAFEEAEMDAAMALVPRASITKLFAVNSGTWNTAGNWYPSGVPGAGDEVCIGEGCVCTYDLDAPTTELNWVRVDGELKTDTTVDTAMLFDTMVITPLGTFRDGTRAKRVDSSKTHEWIIATSNGLIDVSWDTFMQSRGIICIGRADVWASYKTPYLEVVSYTGPAAAATSLELEEEPTGWLVGDEIVIGATRLVGLDLGVPTNEKRTIATISGADITWTGGLTHSHAGPQGSTGRTDMKCYVANLTRNVVFKPDDPDAPIHHRGHLMQMHNQLGWSMRDAEIQNLGRTAKHSRNDPILVYGASGVTPASAVDLTSSDYWVGGSSAIIFGPSFTIRSRPFTAAGSGTLDVVGTDELGNAQTENIAYSSGGGSTAVGVKYFLTVTSITPTTEVTGINIYIDARSRQVNENGVRNLETGSPVHTAINNKTNVQGRYPFHWHKLGISGAILTAPPILDGVTIHSSPGWLFAQHQTHGDIKNCVGYDAPGAGFVAEDGNETGLWQDCISFHHMGNSDGTHKDSYDAAHKDPARSGAAFAFTGRLIRTTGCIAVGAHAGFSFNARLSEAASGVGDLYLTAAQVEQPTGLRGRTANIFVRETPIAHFDRNKGIAVSKGVSVVKSGARQDNDLRSILSNFVCWSTVSAQHLEYTSHYTSSNYDCVEGHLDFTPVQTPGMGFFTNAWDQSIVNPVIDGFKYGIDLDHDNTTVAFETDPLNGRDIVNPTFRALRTSDYLNYNADIDNIYATGDLNSDPISLSCTASSTGVSGTKSDELGTIVHLSGQETGLHTRSTLLTTYGYYVNTPDDKKYVMTDEWFSSRLTGEMKKIRLPVEVTDLALGSYTNNGNMDLSNDTPPTFADFSVSLTRNTNKTIDILALASGNTISFGGFQMPKKTFLINNGDGTITAIPVADENYTETCYVWVDDVNGNTTRATMTINVNKRVLYLGRQDLLA